MMPLSRRWRLLTTMLSLCALLFTQTALAAYACPGAARAVQVAEMTAAGMPCAESMSMAMDDEQPALCHAHCQAAQSLDNTQPTPLPGVALMMGATLTLKPAIEPHMRQRVVQASLLRPDASPSLAVSNCCFRI